MLKDAYVQGVFDLLERLGLKKANQFMGYNAGSVTNPSLPSAQGTQSPMMPAAPKPLAPMGVNGATPTAPVLNTPGVRQGI